ncbi:GNAT family N-acetyltransferase [Amycolatopsis minnesotensis]|uniref:N-acetyltransferase domain-containing protein n=1 Tax=Amycolatopsis minnesotensis TaxID=337894 RepID=A0ABN2QB87_9PSEU
MTAYERTTARLRLRRAERTDLDAFHALEIAIRREEEPPRDPPSRETSAKYLNAFVEVWEAGELGYWTMLHEGRIAGFGGIRLITGDHGPHWNLYYRIDPALHGRGLATEMAREALALAAEIRPQWPVMVETRPGNAAAITVAERAGLTRRPYADGDPYVVLVKNPETAA